MLYLPAIIPEDISRPWRRRPRRGTAWTRSRALRARRLARVRRRCTFGTRRFAGTSTCIASDGTWFYLKTPIGRPALVKLFASVLKREGDEYFLVTPVEKCGLVVEDAPFLAVELKVEHSDRGPTLRFRTNVDDWVACGPGHALRFEPEPETGGLKPYLHVRRDLWAKVTRSLFYDLVELGKERDIDGRRMFGVASAGEFFAMAPADSLKGLA